MINNIVDRYTRLGLATDHITKEKAEEYLLPFYEKILKKDMPRIVIVPSPFAAWEQVRAHQAIDQVWDQIDLVKDQVRQLEEQAWDQIEEQVLARIRAQGDGARVEDLVWEPVWDQVGARVRAQVIDQTGDFIWPFLDGQFSASGSAWYAYFHEIMGVNFDSPIKEYQDLTDLSLIYPLSSVVVLSDKPAEIHRNKVLYRDGYSIYA